MLCEYYTMIQNMKFAIKSSNVLIDNIIFFRINKWNLKDSKY